MAVSKKKLKAAEYNKTFYSTVARMRRRKSGFTVDDIIGKIGNPPQGRTALGALMVNAANKYELAPISEAISTVPSRRHSAVTVWG